VDRLRPELKQVLQSASVMGRLFRRRLLEQTVVREESRRTSREFEQALWELEEQELIYQERAVPEEEYSFKHVLTQETIYESILRRHRAVLHQQVAETMEALHHEGLDEYTEQLAYHYERSHAEEKAVEYLLKAGEKSLRAYLNEEAIGYFQRALARLDGAPSRDRSLRQSSRARLEALKGLGQTYAGMGRKLEAEECFRPAIALGQEMGLAPRELVRLYFWLGEALCYKEGADGSRWDERIRVALEGLALLGADTESVEVALMNSLIEDKSEYREHGDRNAQFIQRLPYSEELRVPYIHIADRYIREGRLEEAEAWLQDVARKAEQHHDLRALGEVYTRTGRLLSARGDFRGAIHQHDRAVDLFTKIGDRSRRYECVWWLVSALFDIRGTEEAAVSARELVEAAGGMELLTKIEDHQRRSSCVELLVAALSDIGGTENAEASVRELLEAAEGAVDEGELASRLHRLGQGCLGRGDFNAARAFCRRAIEIAEGAGNRVDVVAWSSIVMGVVALCEGSWDTAIQAFGDALQLFRETDDAWGEFWATLDLGRTSLVQGERAEAVRQFQEAMRLWRPEFAGQVRDHPSRRLGALAGLQEAYEDLEEFRAFCHQFQQEDPGFGGASFVQWSLEPTQPQYFPQTLSRDDFRTSLSSDWVRAPSPRPRAAPAARWRGWCWYEPVRSNSFQIGTCSVQIHNGLEIQAANRRDLNLGNPWHRKSSAPQLRRSVSGDFALQTVCVPVSGEQPAIGGIFLWRNEWNFLRLDRGTGGEHEVSFTGCLQQEEVVIGRGRLASERVFLRLERLGGRVNALCSGDGESWFTVGHAEFSVEDPVEVGLHASGRIDRTLYPGAYPEGTAIRFEAFQGWCCG
jgi:tetratricopeptide (TPR) repeat protein